MTKRTSLSIIAQWLRILTCCLCRAVKSQGPKDHLARFHSRARKLREAP